MTEIVWSLTKVELHRILLQKLASSPEGPCEPLLLIAHFLTKSAFIPSNIISFIWLKGPWNIMVSFDGFVSGCFWWKFLSRWLKAAKLHSWYHHPEVELLHLPFLQEQVNILAFSSVVCGFCHWGRLFWIVLVSFRRPSTSIFFQRFDLLSTWDFISDILHLFEVLCNIREGITIKALRQISRFGDFEDHSFIRFVSSLIKAFPRAPFGRSKRFLFQWTNSFYPFPISSQYFISLSGSVPIIDPVTSPWSIAWFSLQNCICCRVPQCLKLSLTSWAREWKFSLLSPEFSFCSIFNCSPKHQMLFLQVWLYTLV